VADIPLKKCAALLLAALTCSTTRANAQVDRLPSDIPPIFHPAPNNADYDRRVVMIPMRDGTRLHTVIVVPRGAKGAPIMLTRTPYDAEKATSRTASKSIDGILIPEVNWVSGAGYIIVVQDVRGKYGSEGKYVTTRPPRGPLNPGDIDESTDAWDTIDWLIHNVPETNGRVGMIGGSYDGWLVAMALLDPHPALKVAVPVAAMVDGWVGDDWFHNGAFRQLMTSYVYEQTASRSNEISLAEGVYDDYDLFLRAGTAGALGHSLGMEQLGIWRALLEHPAYDQWWRSQAVDQLLKNRPLKVPTLWVSGLWDQEDIYGGPAAYQASETRDGGNDMNFLALGPWRHMQAAYNGSSLGDLQFGSDTGAMFRQEYLRPFLDHYLMPGAPDPHTPPVLAFETGTNRWRRYDSWPAQTAGSAPKSIFLGPGSTVSFDHPAGTGSDDYVSDPAKPVPFHTRPVLARHQDGSAWKEWLVDDQRPFSDRTDVLTYVGAPLSEPVTVRGRPAVDLFAATSGTDSDWVVKLIDVYPDEMPRQPTLGGYQLPISMDIFRGRYRRDLAKAEPINSGKVAEYRFALPNVDHVFLPGHRVMIQIQSSWFPLYDRNPQSFVANIFNAPPASFVKARQQIFWGGSQATHIDFPAMERGTTSGVPAGKGTDQP
jgi:putative CocE/NonD family hydrolase